MVYVYHLTFQYTLRWWGCGFSVRVCIRVCLCGAGGCWMPLLLPVANATAHKHVNQLLHMRAGRVVRSRLFAGVFGDVYVYILIIYTN